MHKTKAERDGINFLCVYLLITRLNTTKTNINKCRIAIKELTLQ